MAGVPVGLNPPLPVLNGGDGHTWVSTTAGTTASLSTAHVGPP